MDGSQDLGAAAHRVGGNVLVVFEIGGAAQKQRSRIGAGNPDGSAARLAAAALGRDHKPRLEADGRILHQETFTLPPFGHTAFETNDRFPKSANQRGAVTFTAAAGALAPLGLRFSPNFSFTVLPHITLR